MSQGEGSAVAAGARLQEARLEHGLDLGALAAQLKVPAARLEALEAGRWQELPDGPYARGLAKAVCRVLQIDAGPVLQAMPGATPDALARVTVGLNQPFREGGVPAPWARWWWLALAVLAVLLAAVLWFWPGAGWPQFNAQVLREPASGASAEVVAVPAPVPEAASASAPGLVDVPAAAAASEPPTPEVPQPTVAGGPAPSVASAPAAAGLLRISAQQATWISVSDAKGQSLASRLLQPGEVLSLDPATAPIRVTLGNAPGARLEWRGQVQDLSAYAQVRVARLELP